MSPMVLPSPLMAWLPNVLGPPFAQGRDPVVQDFLHLLGLAQDVRLDDADTVAGVNYLESLGLLAEGRAAAVLA